MSTEMDRGYLALWRKIRDNDLWKEKRTFSKAEAWIDLLMEVQHSEKPQTVIIGMKAYLCNYAESLKSIRTWGRRWHWSESKVRRYFKLLEELEMITAKSEGPTTRLSVCNYAVYDPRRRKDNAEATHARRTPDAEAATDNNDKNAKNEKKDMSLRPEAQRLTSVLIKSTEKATGKKLVTKGNSDGVLKLLKKDVPPAEIEKVIRWLCGANLENEFSFDVRSAHSLYKKWDRITAFMTRPKSGESPSETDPGILDYAKQYNEHSKNPQWFDSEDVIDFWRKVYDNYGRDGKSRVVKAAKQYSKE